MARASILALVGLVFAASAAAASTSGLYGTVTRSPTGPRCAVEKPCSGPAVHMKLRFLRGGTAVASTVTDARGRYRVALPRGLYTVRVVGTRTARFGGRIDPASVSVRTTWRRQDFDIDTGIR